MRFPKLDLPFSIPQIHRRKSRQTAPGAPPGTLMVPDEARPDATALRCVYDTESYRCTDVPVAELTEALEPEPGKVVWVDVHGLGDANLLRQIGDALGLHPLILEDVAHTHQRAKVEEFADHLFVVLRTMRLLESGHVDHEQISMVIKDGLLVTFQERSGDGFDSVRKRLREGRATIRQSGADYLAYALIDSVIDHYFPVLDAYGETMDALDDQVREEPSVQVSHGIHAMRRELRQLRRAARPLRDLASELSRCDSPVVSDPVRVALRDCIDHATQVAEFIEGSRERASDLADLHLVMASEKTNQVMKVLTIIATIFIPLTFLCGLYGMNFDPEVSPFNMPELKWRYGYPAFWATMLVVLVGMLWTFWRRGWLGSKSA